jgi:hypothetical protein
VQAGGSGCGRDSISRISSSVRQDGDVLAGIDVDFNAFHGLALVKDVDRPGIERVGAVHGGDANAVEGC